MILDEKNGVMFELAHHYVKSCIHFDGLRKYIIGIYWIIVDKFM